MRTLLLLSTTLAFAGCATTKLTAEGSGIVAMWQTDSAGMLGNCQRLGTLTGDSASVFGGVIGQPQAVADAKNKAAVAGADTVVLTNFWEDFKGSHVNGVTYRCSGATAAGHTAPAVSESGTGKYDELAKLEQLRASGVLSQEEFESEKRKVLSRQ